MVDAGTCRVVVYSMTNAAFYTNGDALMNIIMNGGVEDATISNEVLIRAEGMTGIDSTSRSRAMTSMTSVVTRFVKMPHLLTVCPTVSISSTARRCFTGVRNRNDSPRRNKR